MHNHCIITTIMITIKKRKSLKAMCNRSKCTQFNIICKTENGLRLKNGGNKKDIFPLYVDNKCFQSYSLIRNFRSTIILEKTYQAIMLKHCSWMRVLACLIHTEKRFLLSFEEAFSLPVPLIMYVVTYLKKKKKEKKRKIMNLLINLQLVIRKLTVYSGNCFSKFCFVSDLKTFNNEFAYFKQRFSNT